MAETETQSVANRTVMSVMLIITALATFFFLGLMVKTAWEIHADFMRTEKRFEVYYQTSIEKLQKLYSSRVKGIGRSLSVRGAIVIDDMPLLKKVTRPRFQTMVEEDPAFALLAFYRPDGTVGMLHGSADVRSSIMVSQDRIVDRIIPENTAREAASGFFVPLYNGLHYFSTMTVIERGEYRGLIVVAVRVESMLRESEDLLDVQSAIIMDASMIEDDASNPKLNFITENFATFSTNPLFLTPSVSEAITKDHTTFTHDGRRYVLHRHGVFHDKRSASVGAVVFAEDITAQVRNLALFGGVWLIMTLFCIAGAYAIIRRSSGRMVESLENDYRRTLRELESLNRSLEKRVDEESASRRMHELALLQQSKLSAMGEMVGAIAHQWRQPLNALGLMIQDLADAFAYNQLDQAYIDDVSERSMRLIMYMSNTIDDMRNFYKPSAEAEQFDVRVAAAEVLSLVHAELYNYDIEFDLFCDCEGGERLVISEPGDEMPLCGERYMVHANRNDFKQVILNLLSNARDAILERRSSGGLGTDEGRIEVVLACKKPGYAITVRDNGGGVPTGLSERIFEPFFTTKDEGKGVGIGLYMAKTIIERNMGGVITVANGGDGAEFTILLSTTPNASCTLETRDGSDSSA